MAIHIERVANVRIYEDSTKKDCRYAPRDSAKTVSISTLFRETSSRFSIATSGTETLALGDVSSARGILIRASAAFNLVLNGGADTIAVAPETSAESDCVFMLTGAISSAQLTNPSTTAVLTGEYVVWGGTTA